MSAPGDVGRKDVLGFWVSFHLLEFIIFEKSFARIHSLEHPLKGMQRGSTVPAASPQRKQPRIWLA